MNETPISICQQQIDYYVGIIDRLTTRKGIVGDATQKDIDNAVSEYRIKISEFEDYLPLY